MTEKDYRCFVIARTLHLFSVVFLAGGVEFWTKVLVPFLNNNPNHQDRLALLDQLEGSLYSSGGYT